LLLLSWRFLGGVERCVVNLTYYLTQASLFSAFPQCRLYGTWSIWHSLFYQYSFHIITDQSCYWYISTL
jgi:hypothetical protein